MPAAPLTLSARNLSRRFGQREVVRNVSLELRRGASYIIRDDLRD